MNNNPNVQNNNTEVKQTPQVAIQPNVNNVEVLDLNAASQPKPEAVAEKNLNQSAEEIPVSKDKSSNLLIILIFVIFALFIFGLPFISSRFKNGNGYFFNENEKAEQNSSGLVNGFIQMESEGYMKVSGIKFYNFKKAASNYINIKFISDSVVNNVDGLNMYIEFYNFSEELLYRVKFTEINKIEKDIITDFKVNLDALSVSEFNNINYAKAIIIKESEFNKAKEETLECVFDEMDEGVNIFNEAKFYFKKDVLTKYDMNKNLLYNQTTANERLEELKLALTEEYDLLAKTNLAKIEKEDMLLKYTIDFSNFDVLESSFSLPYNDKMSESVIKQRTSKLGWTCK